MKTEKLKTWHFPIIFLYFTVIYVLEIICNSCIYMVQVLHKVCYCTCLPNSMFSWIT